MKAEGPPGIYTLKVDVRPPLQTGGQHLFSAKPPGVIEEFTVS